MPANSKKEIAVFGGGCFWCTEAIFKMLNGVISVEPGYSGGKTKYPTYEEVQSGETGHIEVVKIEFDSEQIKYRDLLTVFFATHDSTTLNRQGNDIGTQYRSAIFTSSASQERQAGLYIKELNSSGDIDKKIVTEIVSLKEFFPAENYHKEYFKYHGGNMYCQLIIAPKLKKVDKEFARLVKESEKSQRKSIIS